MTTKQLQLAITKATALPNERQDALAALILEEIASEERWEKQFSQSQGVLETLADEALREDERGETQPLNDLIS